MAEYRNVSGVDRALALADWPAPRTVLAGETVVVEDVIADVYDFEQPGVWETVTASPAQLKRAADREAVVTDETSTAPQQTETPDAPGQEGEH